MTAGSPVRASTRRPDDAPPAELPSAVAGPWPVREVSPAGEERAEVVVSFRDSQQPRPLAGRLVAVAHRFPSIGWTTFIPGLGYRAEHLTFDAVVFDVAMRTGVFNPLVVWTYPGGGQGPTVDPAEVPGRPVQALTAVPDPPDEDPGRSPG